MQSCDKGVCVWPKAKTELLTSLEKSFQFPDQKVALQIKGIQTHILVPARFAELRKQV